MVPRGVHAFSGMKIVPIHQPSSTLTKSFSSSLSSEKWISSSQLSSILSDHAYVLRPPDGGLEDDMAWSNGGNEPSVSVDKGNEVFSRRMIGLQNTTECGDADFLSGLDDLDFDLEPCEDVDMAESFQEFIDSALEDSCCSFSGESTQQPELGVEDISKEEFLSSLCLRSTQVQASNSDLQSSLCEKAPDSSCSVMSADEDAQLLDAVPTKRCCCMVSQTFPTTVYSMARDGLQSLVRTSPSSLVTNISDNSCRNCLENRLTARRVMSPLFIDTSFGECSQSLQSSSGDYVDTSVFGQDSSGTDDNSDTTDVTAWLTESPQSNCYTDCLNESCDNIVFAMSENSTSSLDLESFVDLDDYMDEDLQQRRALGYPCDNSQLHPANKDTQQTSLLEKQQNHKRYSSFEFSPHFSFCQSVSPGSRRSESSNLSPCSSPAWSVTDASQLSPLGSLHPSESGPLDNIEEDFSLKGQLALLNLFSEENAESLLLAESSVPTIRFM
ncbi:unnamed protein product [Candidula unifasciata]|uniref:Uncharacterized protein n=1 Tax=Candidula unifasciata TaxID=100452 RepID=A0A8S3Z3P7_9EUPU|nr:unnamed protein product [Candidula unifasciata]